MKRLIINIHFFSLLLISVNAVADGSYLSNSKIELLSVAPDVVYFRGIGNTGQNPDGCSGFDNGGSRYAILKGSHPHFKEVYSMLLAAQVSDKTVSVWVNGCVSRWGRGFPEVVTVNLKE